MSAPRPPGIWARLLAGILLGYPLAVALAGIFVWAVPSGPSSFQLAMWMVAPLWLGLLSTVFLFRDGWRAWAWLGGANAIAFPIMILFRSFTG